jgi:DNA replicative helicase MCM subunit Mcm2 (Cdc46/Mcm family)
MCKANKQSLVVNYLYFMRNPKTSHYAAWFSDYPTLFLPLINQVATDIVLQFYPHYTSVINPGSQLSSNTVYFTGITVRFENYPILQRIPDIRKTDANHMVKTTGIVCRRSSLSMRAKTSNFQCNRCGYVSAEPNNASVFTQSQMKTPKGCPQCHQPGALIPSWENVKYQLFYFFFLFVVCFLLFYYFIILLFYL